MIVRDGTYILFDEYGPAYVGLTRDQNLGKRLKDHLSDKLKDKWNRFSWFGFRPIGDPGPRSGILQLKQRKVELTDNTHATIGDLEALLIRSIGPKLNKASPNFQGAEMWKQIDSDDQEKYLNRCRVPRSR